MLPSSAVSRQTAINVEYRNFNAGAGGWLPQRLAVIGVGNDDAVYGSAKYESLGSSGDIGERYGYGSPLHLAARQLFPVGGGGANFPVTFYPLQRSAGTAAKATVLVTNTTEAAIPIPQGTYSYSDGGRTFNLIIPPSTTLDAGASNTYTVFATVIGVDPNLTTGVLDNSLITPSIPDGLRVEATAVTQGTPAGSAPAEGSIAVAGTPTSAGSGTAIIGGIGAEFPIPKGATANAILLAMQTAIQAKLEMPVAAGLIDEDNEELPLTAKWSGETGNEISIFVETDVEGVTFTVGQMSGGAIDPDVTPALAQIGEIWETFILSCFSWKKPTRLDAYFEYGVGRWDQLEKKPLMVAHGCVDDYATRTAVTDTRKTDFINFLIQSTGSRELSFVIAAKGLVSDIMTTANINPPTDYQGLLTGLHRGDDSVQENGITRNNALLKGASTNIVNGSVAELNDIVTFYHPANEEVPPRRYVVDLVKLQNIVYRLENYFGGSEFKGPPPGAG